MCREMDGSTISALPGMMARGVPAQGRSVSAYLTTRGLGIAVGIKGGSLIQLGAPDLGTKEVSQSGVSQSGVWQISLSVRGLSVRSQHKSQTSRSKSQTSQDRVWKTCPRLALTCFDSGLLDS